jgi:hypothetical protein
MGVMGGVVLMSGAVATRIGASGKPRVSKPSRNAAQASVPRHRCDTVG